MKLSSFMTALAIRDTIRSAAATAATTRASVQRAVEFLRDYRA